MTQSEFLEKIDASNVASYIDSRHDSDSNDEYSPKLRTSEDDSPAQSIIRYVRSAALGAATAKQKPSPWTKNLFQLYGIAAVASLTCIANSYITTILMNVNNYSPAFQEYFGTGYSLLEPATGAVGSMFAVGSICSFFFVGPAADYKGRKFGMFLTAAIFFLFSIVNASAQNLPQLLISRFFLGFASAITPAPIYITEIAHPSYRGAFGGLYNTAWFIGSTMTNVFSWKLNPSWRLPLWCQLIFPGLLAVGVFFLPESPRWLMANGREDEAFDFMVKYHGDGDRESAIALLEYDEMKQNISSKGADKRFWDFSEFFTTPELRYRIMLSTVMSLFAQLSGIWGIAYYYAPMLDKGGLKRKYSVFLLSTLMSLANFCISVFGSVFADSWGRRKGLLTAFTIFVVVFAIQTGLAGTNLGTDPTAGTPVGLHVGASRAFSVFVNIWGATYAACITPITLLYAIEVLPYENRAKGMALYTLANAVTLFYNQYATSIAFTKIAWKYFLVYIAFDIFAIGFIWKFFVETANRTLEEMTEIFRSEWPVKTSTAKSKIVISGDEIIINDIDSIY